MNSHSLCILTLLQRFFLITTIIGCGSFSIVRAQGPLAESDPRNSFPESTYFVFRSQNVRETTQAIASSTFGERLAAEPWATLSAMHRQKNIPSILNTLPWMGIEWRELESVASEGYFIGFLDSKKQPHVAFMINLGKDADTHPFVAAWKKAFSKDRTLKESKLSDSVKLWNSDPKSPGSAQALLAIGPQWTVISSSPFAITEWLNTQTSGPKTESPIAEKIFATSTSSASVQFWLLPWPLLRSYTETSEPKLFKSFSKLGISQIRECVGEIQLVDNPVPSWNITAELRWTEPLQNAMAVLSLVEGNKIELPKVMQGTTPETKFDNYSILYLDNKPWFQGISYLADLSIDEDTPGGFADILDSLLTDPEGPKIDVRQEVIYKLGNPMIIGGSTIKDRKKDTQYQRQLLTAFPFPDTAEMRKMLQRMFEGDEEVIHEDIGDFQIWHTVHNESLFISLSESETQTITAAAVDKTHVYLATDTQWLKSLIEEANRTTTTQDAADLKNEPISIRQNFDLTSWLQKSWLRIPERTPDRKDYEATDLPALILTNTFVPQTDASDLPAWSEAKDLFGSITVIGNKSKSGVKLSISWK
jgi:hypothetical protein